MDELLMGVVMRIPLIWKRTASGLIMLGVLITLPCCSQDNVVLDTGKDRKDRTNSKVGQDSQDNNNGNDGKAGDGHAAEPGQQVEPVVFSIHRASWQARPMWEMYVDPSTQKSVYIEPKRLVTNADVVSADHTLHAVDGSRAIAVRVKTTTGNMLQRATQAWQGEPMAIRLEDRLLVVNVVAAIGEYFLISGQFESEAEAVRIGKGIMLQAEKSSSP